MAGAIEAITVNLNLNTANFEKQTKKAVETTKFAGFELKESWGKNLKSLAKGAAPVALALGAIVIGAKVAGEAISKVFTTGVERAAELTKALEDAKGTLFLDDISTNVNKDDLKNIDTMNFAIEEMANAWKDVALVLVSDVSPHVTAIAGALQEIAGNDIRGVFDSIAGGIAFKFGQLDNWNEWKKDAAEYFEVVKKIAEQSKTIDNQRKTIIIQQEVKDKFNRVGNGETAEDFPEIKKLKELNAPLPVIEGVQKQLETIKQYADEQKRIAEEAKKELELRDQITKAMLAGAEAANEFAEKQFKKEQELKQKADQEDEEIAKKLIESTITAESKVFDLIELVERLSKKGLLDPDVADAAVNKAIDDLIPDRKRPSPFDASVVRGSQEDFRLAAFNKFGSLANDPNDIAKKTEKNTAEAVKELRTIARNKGFTITAVNWN